MNETADKKPNETADEKLRRLEIAQIRLLAEKRPNELLKIAEEIYQQIVTGGREVVVK